MAGVIFDGVTKRFGDVLAVNNLTLEIPDREFLVLVGPSGCGKSTCLRLLAGLEEVDRGNVFIGERLVNNVNAKDRDIAMVFQSYALYPHMSVYDNLAFGLTLRKTPQQEIQGRVTTVAEMLDIQALLERKPGQLSGGQRQRVALGRAIVREPAVFLMDEPLSNLDAALRVQTRVEISKLHQRLGTTFIYVTHDQVEAMTMATKIAVMRDGVLQQVGKPQEVYDNPANVFVASFIGSPAMNFFDVTVSSEEDGIFLDGSAFQIQVPPDKADRLAPLRGERIIFGIRPENIHDRNYAPPGILASMVHARVEVTELMGNEIFLHLVNGVESFLARVDPRSEARPGHDMEMTMDLSKIYFFHPLTEQNLLGGP